MQISANNANKIKDSEIIFPDLSYKVVGIAFEVFNELGWGLPEKDYQKAMVKEFSNSGISFKEEYYIPLKYKASSISRYFADFVVDDKILLELKVVPRLGYVHTKQTLIYLRNAGIKLGILLYFTRDGVKYRRIINSKI
ncbi:GxxExxY protein [Candidatus Wolfebacteria bacterium]|nr:GxxExxY protein [Candidatus Wolfebacteria bacterium]